MAILYDSVLASTPFRFLVGRDKKLFTVHSALIAYHSKPLGVLVHGDMAEAKEGCALLEDIDKETFVRFSQFAYTGDYVAADPDILLDSTAVATTHSAPNNAFEDQIIRASEGVASPRSPKMGSELLAEWPADAPSAPDELDLTANGWGRFSGAKKDKKKEKTSKYVIRWGDEAASVPVVQSKRSKLWEVFKSKVYTTSRSDFQPRKNRESCEDYTQVLLCHAQLYVFADKYDVDPLKALSLHKLQRTLVEFTLYDKRIGDIVNLIQYSYTNTTDRSEPIDELRSLVIHYAACKIEDLARNIEFRLLLEEAGSLARDLVEHMIERLD